MLVHVHAGGQAIVGTIEAPVSASGVERGPGDAFPLSEIRFAAYEARKPRASGAAIDIQRLAKACKRKV
jgi:hypothetical protein